MVESKVVEKAAKWDWWVQMWAGMKVSLKVASKVVR